MSVSAAEAIRPEIRDQILGFCHACSSSTKHRDQLRAVLVPQIGCGLVVSSQNLVDKDQIHLAWHRPGRHSAPMMNF